MYEEWSQEQLLAYQQNHPDPLAIFMYSPFCGTCKLANRMLELISHIDHQLHIVRNNILYSPILTKDWKVQSIPAIVYLENYAVVKIRYKMVSVDELLQDLQIFLRSD